MIDRDQFFNRVRADPFGGTINQSQVDGLSYLLDAWERHFRDNDIRWLAYALATAYWETAQTMQPIEEYGRGSGYDYGEPVPPHGQAYYGRGFVQLTWATNYEKCEKALQDEYGLECPMYQYAHRALEHEPAALVLYYGMITGLFTGAKLSQFFNTTTENPYDARTVVNGHDRAADIEKLYWAFKAGLV